VIRPKRFRQSFFVFDGDTPADTRRRWRQAAPAIVVPLLGLGYGVVVGVRDHGFLVPVAVGVLIGTLIGVAVLTLLVERPRALHVTAGELVVERWWGRRRHLRSSLERAETTRVLVGRADADELTTFVLGPPRRRLVRLLGPRRRTVLALSRQQWHAADIAALVDRLGLPHVVHEGEVLFMAEVRRRYRGAFGFAKRRPFVAGTLITVGLLAALLLGAWAAAGAQT